MKFPIFNPHKILIKTKQDVGGKIFSQPSLDVSVAFSGLHHRHRNTHHYC